MDDFFDEPDEFEDGEFEGEEFEGEDPVDDNHDPMDEDVPEDEIIGWEEVAFYLAMTDWEKDRKRKDEERPSRKKSDDASDKL